MVFLSEFNYLFIFNYVFFLMHNKDTNIDIDILNCSFLEDAKFINLVINQIAIMKFVTI